MLINFYRKILELTTQWFETNAVIFNPDRAPVRVRIEASDNTQPHAARRIMTASKRRR